MHKGALSRSLGNTRLSGGLPHLFKKGGDDVFPGKNLCMVLVLISLLKLFCIVKRK